MFKDDDDDDEATMGAVRYPVMPSLVALQQMRNRLHLAYLGKKLMKWTALATGKEMRRLAMEMAGTVNDYGPTMRKGFMLLARARYFIPLMNSFVLENVPRSACIKVQKQRRSVAGVKVMDYHVKEMGCDSYPYLGLNKGGMLIKQCKEIWYKIIRMTVFLCEHRITFDLIDTAHKNATKKQNVLQRCIIPRIAITMRYILSELDEREREETFRLKRFKQLKYEKMKEKEKYDEKKNALLKPKEAPPPEKVQSVEKIKEIIEDEPVEVEQITEKIGDAKHEDANVETEKIDPIIEKMIEEEIISDSRTEERLEQFMTHVQEVINLAGQLECAAKPPDNFGLTRCDLTQLRLQLHELIKLSQDPKSTDGLCKTCEKSGKTMSQCSCFKANNLELLKYSGFDECQNLMSRDTRVPKTSIPEYIMKPQPLIDTTADFEPMSDDKPISTTRLHEFEKHIDEVIDMTHYYQNEGLLSRNADFFLKSCQSVKFKIQEYKEQRKIKAKIERLKEQVANLERITDTVQREELSSTSISSFLSCCKEFKAKLDGRKSSRGPPTAGNLEKLVSQIDDSVVLSQRAKKEGLLNESVDEFIKSCQVIKAKINPHNVEPKPRVIDELLFNINDILDFISKYREEGLMSQSIEEFYKTCENTKAKLDCYKRRPVNAEIEIQHDLYTKSSCYDKCKENNAASPDKASSERFETPLAEPIIPCSTSTCLNIKKQPSEYSCKSISFHPSPSQSLKSFTKSTCGQVIAKKPSKSFTKSKSSNLSQSLAPCTASLCSSVSKQPSKYSCETSRPATSKKSKEKSKSDDSIKTKLSSQIKMRNQSINYETKVCKTKTMKIVVEKDGNIVEDYKTITIKQRVFNAKQTMVASDASSYTTASCASVESTKRIINICDVPQTKGFIQTVRAAKSETFIRSLDLSSPLIWSCVSADTLNSRRRSNENETGQSSCYDPFFCSSPTTSYDSRFISPM